MPMRIESNDSSAASVARTSSAASTTAAAATSASSSASTTTAIDPATGEPVLPKFPWISHLSLRLQENAQKEKVSPFKPAEIAGETLNKLA